MRVLGSSTARRSLSDSVLVRAVLETSSEAFVGVGTDGAIEDWNTAAQRLFGLQRDQVIGRSIDRLVHKGCLSPPGEDGLAQVLLHPPSAEVRTTMRARARHASGREFPVLISLLRGAGPSGWSVRAFVRDPSERQAPEQDSPPEEARLERLPDALSPEEQLSEHGRRADDAARAAVMEIMAEGVLVVDHLGLLTAMNRAAGKLLGWSEDDMAGRCLNEIAKDERLAEAWRGGEATQLDGVPLVRKDGPLLRVACTATPLRSRGLLRGAVVVFHAVGFEDASAPVLEELRQERELREAMSEHRVVLYAQPIRSLRGKQDREALFAGMVGRNGEAQFAGRLPQVAERLGLAGEIDRWVTGEAIRRAARGHRVHAALSPGAISSREVLALLERQLAETAADPAALSFGLTETALAGDLEQSERFARRLRQLGLGLGLDGFGSGRAGLVCVKRLLFSAIEIDAEFVRKLATSAPDQSVVRATVGLAKAFGAEPGAAGVADAETLEVLGRLGVDYARGPRLGEPVLVATLAPCSEAAGAC